MCTNCFFSCTNIICFHLSASLSYHKTVACHSGSIISVEKTPGSLARLIYPLYLSTTISIRLRPCPWSPRLLDIYSASSFLITSPVELVTAIYSCCLRIHTYILKNRYAASGIFLQDSTALSIRFPIITHKSMSATVSFSVSSALQLISI